MLADGGGGRPATADLALASAQDPGPLRVTIKGGWGTPSRPPPAINGAPPGPSSVGGGHPAKKKRKKQLGVDAPLPKLRIKSTPQSNGGWNHQVAQAAAAAAVAGHPLSAGSSGHGSGGRAAPSPAAAPAKPKRKYQKRPKGAPPKVPASSPSQQVN